jgi:hypothetical protein
MLTAMVLVCSILITPDVSRCDPTNARVVMRLPEEHASPVTCSMRGQAYLAETAVGRNLAASDRVKVVCVHRDKVDQEIATLPKQ